MKLRYILIRVLSNVYYIDRNLSILELKVLINQGGYDTHIVKAEKGSDDYVVGKRININELNDKIGIIK